MRPEVTEYPQLLCPSPGTPLHGMAGISLTESLFSKPCLACKPKPSLHTLSFPLTMPHRPSSKAPFRATRWGNAAWALHPRICPSRSPICCSWGSAWRAAWRRLPPGLGGCGTSLSRGLSAGPKRPFSEVMDPVSGAVHSADEASPPTSVTGRTSILRDRMARSRMDLSKARSFTHCDEALISADKPPGRLRSNRP